MLVTCAIIIQNERFLLTKRPLHKHQGGKWEFPGGKVNSGEKPAACIVREIMEELDLLVSVEQVLPAVKHQYTDKFIELCPFICSISDGSIILHEHSDFKWVTLSEAVLMDLCEADRKVLKLIAGTGGTKETNIF